MANPATPSLFATPHQPEYDHVQSAPMYWLMLAPGLVVMAVAVANANDLAMALPLTFVGGILLYFALSFQHLRVADEGDHLAVRYGPLPMFRKRVRYAEIATAEQDRSSFVDGWGIHWVPGRGWTYNLWGFDCVRLTLTNGRTLRIGTDDPSGLAAFLQAKCARRA